MILEPIKNNPFATNNDHSMQRERRILIIDDLDALIENNDDESSKVILSHERRASLHAVLESIDEIVQTRKHHPIKISSIDKKDDHNNNITIPFILGICRCDPMDVPSILNRIGRFEKIVTMLPPSEIQRREILKSMIQQLPVIGNTDNGSIMMDDIVHTWSVVLARTTAGCVASDLQRICMDAMTRSQTRNYSKDKPIPIISDVDDEEVADDENDITSLCRIIESKSNSIVTWEDLREATRSCLPSQLADLDVSFPMGDENQIMDPLNNNMIVDKRGTKEWFEECWKNLGGYEEIKADLYRTVFRPWCRRHYDKLGKIVMSKLERDVPPPTGILFHGVSGTGKTFAADCLAKALGLNVIKVRNVVCACVCILYLFA